MNRVCEDRARLTIVVPDQGRLTGRHEAALRFFGVLEFVLQRADFSAGLLYDRLEDVVLVEPAEARRRKRCDDRLDLAEVTEIGQAERGVPDLVVRREHLALGLGQLLI